MDLKTERLVRSEAPHLFGISKQAGPPARGAIVRIDEKSISRNAIADGANSAATCAPAQGHQLGIDDKEAAPQATERTPTAWHTNAKASEDASASSTVANASENRILPIPAPLRPVAYRALALLQAVH
jgi:hypothetical protein